MYKKTLIKLAAESLTKNNLDEKNMQDISIGLSRKKAKLLVSELKEQKQRSTVYVQTAFPLRNKDEYLKELQNLFPNKKIEFQVDPSLILGVRIVDNDHVFEVNMNNLLNKMENHLAGSI